MHDPVQFPCSTLPCSKDDTPTPAKRQSAVFTGIERSSKLSKSSGNSLFLEDRERATFRYESPALTAELPDRCIAVGWCDESDAADGELSIVAEGWSGGRAGWLAGSSVSRHRRNQSSHKYGSSQTRMPSSAVIIVVINAVTGR